MRGTIKMINKIYRLLRLNSLKRILRFWFTLLILLFVVLSYLPFFLYGKEFREIETQNNIQQIINLQQLVIDKWFEDKSASILTISQLPDVRAMEKGKMK